MELPGCRLYLNYPHGLVTHDIGNAHLEFQFIFLGGVVFFNPLKKPNIASPAGVSRLRAGPGPTAPPGPAHLARHPAVIRAALPEAPAVAADSPHQLLLVGEIHLPDEGAVAEHPHGGRGRPAGACAEPGAAPGRLRSRAGSGAAGEPFSGPACKPPRKPAARALPTSPRAATLPQTPQRTIP